MIENQNKGIHFLAIAGNIGAGKSSLTALIAKHYNWNAVYESVDDNPYLADFYEDMKRWSFNLQIYFLSSRFRHQKQLMLSTESFVQDRTIYEDVEIFAKNLFEMSRLKVPVIVVIIGSHMLQNGPTQFLRCLRLFLKRFLEFQNKFVLFLQGRLLLFYSGGQLTHILEHQSCRGGRHQGCTRMFRHGRNRNLIRRNARRVVVVLVIVVSVTGRQRRRNSSSR